MKTSTDAEDWLTFNQPLTNFPNRNTNELPTGSPGINSYSQEWHYLGREAVGRYETPTSMTQSSTYLAYVMETGSAVICPHKCTSITKRLHAALGIAREYILFF